MVSLPPGPRLPKWMQTLGFMFFNARFLDGARRRHGDVVTFRSLFDSAFVIVFSPELVKQVFRAPPDQLRAGEANALLGPIVGERSVLLLDGREHMRQRKLLLPPFHGERMRAYEEVMVEATDRVIDGWSAGDQVTLLPAMQDVTLEVIERTVFGVADTRRRAELTRRVRALLDPVNSRGQVLMLVLTGGRRGAGAGEEFVRARQGARRAAVRGDRPPPRRARPRGTRGRAFDAAVRPRRGGRADDRRRAARRAADAAGGRPRDHRHRAGMGVRAADAQPRHGHRHRRRNWTPWSRRRCASGR